MIHKTHQLETKTLPEIVKEYRKGIVKYNDQFALILNEKHSNGATNLLYYKNGLDIAAQQLAIELANIPHLEECSKKLQLFNHLVLSLVENNIEFFITCAMYDLTKRGDEILSEVKDNQEVCLQNLTHFSIQIEREIIQGNIQRAEEIKKYCLYILRWVPIYMENHMFIEVANTPIGSLLSSLRDTFTTIPGNSNNDEVDTIEFSSDSDFNRKLVYNPNYWCDKTYKLFHHLFYNFYDDGRKTNTKLLCIWFFLKDDLKGEFRFNLSKEKYIEILKTEFKLKITNFSKPPIYESQKSLLQTHTTTFLNEISA